MMTKVSLTGEIEAGRVSDQLVIGADLLPTFAAMMGASKPEEVKWDGTNLLPHWKKSTALKERDLFWEFKKHLAMRRGNFKLVTHKDGKSPELYDLNNDLGESKNLAKEKPQLTEEMLQAVQAWYTEITAGVEKRT